MPSTPEIFKANFCVDQALICSFIACGSLVVACGAFGSIYYCLRRNTSTEAEQPLLRDSGIGVQLAIDSVDVVVDGRNRRYNVLDTMYPPKVSSDTDSQHSATFFEGIDIEADSVPYNV